MAPSTINDITVISLEERVECLQDRRQDFVDEEALQQQYREAAGCCRPRESRSGLVRLSSYLWCFASLVFPASVLVLGCTKPHSVSNALSAAALLSLVISMAICIPIHYRCVCPDPRETVQLFELQRNADIEEREQLV
jgi:hypothetical protein